ncbi:MAG: DUF3244 domain-containing protein [Paludibacter sp.]
MKRTILFTVFALLTFSMSAITKGIDLTKDPINPGPRPLSLTYIPVSATVDETELAVYFDMSVGNAIITVYDDMHQIVSQQTVDTTSISEVFIPTNEWTAGSYTLTITYGTTNLTGDFQL